jgi:hypothetical protein
MRSLLLAACFAFLGSAFDPLNSSWALHRHGAAAQREFLGWLSGHARAVVGPLRLESEPGGVGLRAVASRAIAAGETLLAVPEEAGISVSGGWRHPVLAPLLRAAYAAARSGALPPRFAERLLRDDDLAAARAAHLHFLVFVEGARGALGPALRMLPTAWELRGHPRFFGARAAAAAREASVLGGLVRPQAAATAALAELLHAALWSQPGFPPLPPGGAAARRRELTWVAAVLDSRLFAARSPLDESALIPLLDLLNHRAGSPIMAAVARPRGAGDAEDDPRAPDFFAGYAGAATQLWDAALGAFVPMSRQRYRLHAWTLATPVAVPEGEELFTVYFNEEERGGAGMHACAAYSLAYYGFLPAASAPSADCVALAAREMLAGCPAARAPPARRAARLAAARALFGAARAALLAAVDAEADAEEAGVDADADADADEGAAAGGGGAPFLLLARGAPVSLDVVNAFRLLVAPLGELRGATALAGGAPLPPQQQQQRRRFTSRGTDEAALKCASAALRSTEARAGELAERWGAEWAREGAGEDAQAMVLLLRVQEGARAAAAWAAQAVEQTLAAVIDGSAAL